MLEPTDELTAMSACPAHVPQLSAHKAPNDRWAVVSFPGNGHGADGVGDRSRSGQECDAGDDSGYLSRNFSSANVSEAFRSISNDKLPEFGRLSG